MTGVVEKILDTEHVNEKFKKRTFVVNDQADKYPQKISFQTVQDKVSMLDSIMEGQEVEVSFNLRGREWTSPQFCYGRVRANRFSSFYGRISKPGRCWPGT